MFTKPITYKEIEEILNDKRKTYIVMDFIKKYLDVLKNRNRKFVNSEQESK